MAFSQIPRVYLAFARTSFQMRMQYRVANLAGLTTNFFFLVVQIFVYTGFYAAAREPQPLSLTDIRTYVVLCQSFLLLMPLWGGRSEIAETVKDGSVALQLVKPVDFQAYWFADALGTAFYYLLMRSLPTFWLGKLIFGAVFPQQLDIGIAFAVSMLLAICLSIAITVSVRSVAFWTLDATGVNYIAHTVITFFSGLLVPISLWPEWVARIARWLPFEGLIDIPFSIYLGTLTGTDIWLAIGKQVVWTLVFIGIGRVLITRGFSRLVIQGG